MLSNRHTCSYCSPTIPRGRLRQFSFSDLLCLWFLGRHDSWSNRDTLWQCENSAFFFNSVLVLKRFHPCCRQKSGRCHCVAPLPWCSLSSLPAMPSGARMSKSNKFVALLYPSISSGFQTMQLPLCPTAHLQTLLVPNPWTPWTPYTFSTALWIVFAM